MLEGGSRTAHFLIYDFVLFKVHARKQGERTAQNVLHAAVIPGGAAAYRCLCMYLCMYVYKFVCNRFTYTKILHPAHL